MLSIIPIIFVVTALVGITVMVVRRFPELQKEPVTAAHPSWVSNSALKSLMNWFLATIQALGRQTGKAWSAAKSEVRNSRDLAKHVSLNALHRFEKKKHIKVQSADVPQEPESDTEFLESAERLYDQGQFIKAEEEAIEALKADPANRSAYEFLGKVYLSRKNFLEAVEVYRYLIKQLPKNENYWTGLGDGLVGLEDYEEAASAYRKSLEIYHNPKVFVSLGLAYQAVADYASAGRAFESALDLEPENTQVLMLLAENLLHRNETDSAQEVFEEILELEPGNMVARERLMQLKL